jgi:hypothetical protein
MIKRTLDSPLSIQGDKVYNVVHRFFVPMVTQNDTSCQLRKLC